MKITITKKISKVGSSSGIIIDKPILEKLDLKYGDYVEVTLEKKNGK